MTKLRYLFKLAWGEPARVVRHSRFWLSGRLYPRYKRAAVVIPCSGGLGDNLMATAVAREVRKRNPAALIHIITRLPAVFDRNPDVDFVSTLPRGARAWKRAFRVRYSLGFPWKRHFLHYLCGCVDIRDRIDLRTYIFPQKDDWAFADEVLSKLGAAPILLARTAGLHDAKRKQWPAPHWFKVATELARQSPVLDIGNAGEPLAISSPSYRSMLGQPTIHQLAALMGRSRGLITMDSASNHLAAAFDLPTVCILGGVFPAVAIAYPGTKVLTSRPACCDCWPENGCQHNLQCLVNITPEEVLSAFDEISRLNSGGRRPISKEHDQIRICGLAQQSPDV